MLGLFTPTIKVLEKKEDRLTFVSPRNLSAGRSHEVKLADSRRVRVLVMAIALLAGRAAAAGQGNAAGIEPFTLGTVLVAGQRIELEGVGDDKVATVVTADQMQRFGRHDVADAMNLLSGVTIEPPEAERQAGGRLRAGGSRPSPKARSKTHERHRRVLLPLSARRRYSAGRQSTEGNVGRVHAGER